MSIRKTIVALFANSNQVVRAVKEINVKGLANSKISHVRKHTQNYDVEAGMEFQPFQELDGVLNRFILIIKLNRKNRDNLSRFLSSSLSLRS
jgi:hypothetical protein